MGTRILLSRRIQLLVQPVNLWLLSVRVNAPSLVTFALFKECSAIVAMFHPMFILPLHDCLGIFVILLLLFSSSAFVSFAFSFIILSFTLSTSTTAGRVLTTVSRAFTFAVLPF